MFGRKLFISVTLIYFIGLISYEFILIYIFTLNYITFQKFANISRNGQKQDLIELEKQNLTESENGSHKKLSNETNSVKDIGQSSSSKENVNNIQEVKSDQKTHKITFNFNTIDNAIDPS